MEKDLANKILEGNIELHQAEAEFYDQVHPEIFNQSEQKLTQQVLDIATSKIDSQLIQAHRYW